MRARTSCSTIYIPVGSHSDGSFFNSQTNLDFHYPDSQCQLSPSRTLLSHQLGQEARACRVLSFWVRIPKRQLIARKVHSPKMPPTEALWRQKPNPVASHTRCYIFHLRSLKSIIQEQAEETIVFPLVSRDCSMRISKGKGPSLLFKSIRSRTSP